MESFKKGVNRKELAKAALAYVFADVLPTTLMLMFLVFIFMTGIMAVCTYRVVPCRAVFVLLVFLGFTLCLFSSRGPAVGRTYV